MHVDVKVDKRDLEKYVKNLYKNSMHANIGWDNKLNRKQPAYKTNRRNTPWGSGRALKGKRSSVSNAMVALMLLKRGYNFTKPVYDRTAWGKVNFKRFIQKWAENPKDLKAKNIFDNTMLGVVKQGIFNYNDKKNKLSTIKNKGSSKPLKDTMQFIIATRKLDKRK